MVKRRNPYPEVGEIIIGTIKAVNPNSALVSLDEYGKNGLVHVSEISRKWVRDIRQFAKIGDKIVCTVMEVDKTRDHINLSSKRVSDGEKNRRLQDWKLDQKGEKLLEKVAQKMGVNLDKVYEKIGFDIQDAFRNMLEAFETALDDITILERKGLDKKSIELIKEIASENIEIKEKEMKGIVEVKCFAPDAVTHIKKAFTEAQSKYGIEVKYISAPEYSISYKTKDLKKGDKILNEAAEFICSQLKKKQGECDFRRNKEM